MQHEVLRCRPGIVTGSELETIPDLRRSAERAAPRPPGNVASGELRLRRLGDFSRRLQRLVEIGDDVVDMLDADRQPDIVVGHAGRLLLLGRELRVGGGRRMDGERARVADIGDVIEELERVDELAPRLLAALDLEPDQAAQPALEIFFGAPALASPF